MGVLLHSDHWQGTKQGQTSHMPPTGIALTVTLFNSIIQRSDHGTKTRPTNQQRIFFFLFKKSCVTFECTWNPLLCLLDLVQRWQSPPYGCHSLNSYNICLCQTTEFIQCINNETMATFHSATRLWAQWNTVKAFKAFFVCWMNRASYKTRSWDSYSTCVWV